MPVTFRNINRVLRYQNAAANLEQYYRRKGFRGAVLTSKMNKVARHFDVPLWYQHVRR